jgi:hypothetical protein
MNSKTYTYPSVLTIAGFDGSGGAGIQADMKTISALGCYATSALTALPVQNTTGVKSIFSIPENVVGEQIEMILEDIFPDAVKIDMVHTPALVETIVEKLSHYPNLPIVFDPVMVATSGDHLIEDETIQSIVQQLFPIANVITPNLDEAAILAEMKIETVEEMKIAVIPLGYADGINRKLRDGKGKVLINNASCSIIGKISMDSFMIDISGTNAKEGDLVTIFSKENLVVTIAKNLDTIAYEILATLNRRIKRVYH